MYIKTSAMVAQDFAEYSTCFPLLGMVILLPNVLMVPLCFHSLLVLILGYLIYTSTSTMREKID